MAESLDHARPSGKLGRVRAWVATWLRLGHGRHWRGSCVFAATVSLSILAWFWTRTPLYLAQALVRVEVPAELPEGRRSTLAVRDHEIAMGTAGYREYFWDRVSPRDREVFNTLPRASFIRTSQVRGSHLIRIQVRSASGEVSARLAQQYAQYYGDYLVFRQREVLRGQYDTLSRREAAQRFQVERSREALQQFLRDFRAVDGGGLLGERERLKSQREVLAREYAAAELAVLTAKNGSQSDSRAAMPSQDLEKVAETRRLASQQLLKLDEAIGRLDDAANQEDGDNARFAGLKAQLEADDRISAQLRDKLAELKVALALPSKPVVFAVDEAIPENRAVTPGRWGSLLLSGIAFAGAFLLFPVCRAQAEWALPLLWLRRGIPNQLGGLAALRVKGSRQMLAECLEPPSRDAFRQIIQALDREFAGESNQCLLVTSAREREGKSFVAAGLAAVACSQGLRVLLVDCHLASPSVGLWFPGADSGCGLLEWLQARGVGSKQLSCQRQGEGRGGELFVVSSRGWASDPASLLGQPCFAAWLRRAREEFDWVILDGPEVNASGEAAVLAAMSDGVLLVRDAGVSTIGDLARVSRKLTFSGSRVVGNVNNRVELASR